MQWANRTGYALRVVATDEEGRGVGWGRLGKGRRRRKELPRGDYRVSGAVGDQVICLDPVPSDFEVVFAIEGDALVARPGPVDVRRRPRAASAVTGRLIG